MFFPSHSFERSILHLFLTINSIKILYFLNKEKYKNNQIWGRIYEFVAFYYLMLVKRINLELLLPPNLTVKIPKIIMI